jgi:hypothetical protein
MYNTLSPHEVDSGVIPFIISFHTTIVGVWGCNLGLLMDISLIKKTKIVKKPKREKLEKKVEINGNRFSLIPIKKISTFPLLQAAFRHYKEA